MVWRNVKWPIYHLFVAGSCPPNVVSRTLDALQFIQGKPYDIRHSGYPVSCGVDLEQLCRWLERHSGKTVHGLHHELTCNRSDIYHRCCDIVIADRFWFCQTEFQGTHVLVFLDDVNTDVAT